MKWINHVKLWLLCVSLMTITFIYTKSTQKITHYPENNVQKQEEQIQSQQNETAIVPCKQEVQPEVTEKINTSIVMFVPTVISWEDRRRSFYKQFDKENWMPSDVILIFVVGTRNGNKLLEKADSSGLIKYPKASYHLTPCRDYGDELDNPDGTSSTICKVYEGIKHIVKNFQATWVWRVDNDSYLNLQLFFGSIKHMLPTELLYYGKLQNVPIQQTESVKLPFRLGNYMSGAGYLLTFDVATLIASFNIPPHFVSFEDVMMGMWLNPFQIQFLAGGDLFHDLLDGAVESNSDHLLVHRVFDELWDCIDSNGRFMKTNQGKCDVLIK